MGTKRRRQQRLRTKTIYNNNLSWLFALLITSVAVREIECHGKQYRVKRGKRIVPYPIGHPLSRYLNNNGKEEEEEQDHRSTSGVNASYEDDEDVTVIWSVRTPSASSIHHDDDTSGVSSENKGTNYTVHDVSEDDTAFFSKKEIDDDDDEIEAQETDTYRPIRMQAVLTNEILKFENLNGNATISKDEMEYVMEDIMRVAMDSWSKVLMVIPVQGNLAVDAGQLYDGKSCGPGLDSGLPSPLVPKQHLTEGLEGTDLVLYVSLGIRKSPEEEGESSILSTCQSSSEVIAAATYCSTDQYDRPTAGEIHICIDRDTFFAPEKRISNILAVMHEIGHVLGMNSQSLAHFRYEDGRPMTPRLDDSDVPDVEVWCTGPESMLQTQGKQVVPLPSSTALQFETVRGGIRVAHVTTPHVRLITQNHFDCPALPGAELNAYGEEDDCIGNHWSRRLFKTDLLNPVLDNDVMPSLYISPLTLAYFWDSGWYRIDFEKMGNGVSGWGRAAGCDFVTETCLDGSNGTVVPGSRGEFCSRDGEFGCTDDIARKALCRLQRPNDDENESVLPPEEYRYTAENDAFHILSGLDPFLEYCPTYTGYANGLCNDPNSETMLRVHPMEDFRVPNSRCVLGYQPQPSFSTFMRVPLCLPIACVISDKSLRIQVDGLWKTCAYAGQRIEQQTNEDDDELHKGYVVCPDPMRICPTFYCPRDCLDTDFGVCDYSTGQCMCSSSPTSATPPSNTNASSVKCTQAIVTDDFFFSTSSHNSSSDDSNDRYNTSSYNGFFETKLSQYYVVNATFLQNHDMPPLHTDTSDATSSPLFNAPLFLAVLAVLFFLGSIFFLKNKYTTRREQGRNKNKFIATMLLDLRVHDPQILRSHSRMSRAAREAMHQQPSSTEQKMKKRPILGQHTYSTFKRRKLIVCTPSPTHPPFASSLWDTDHVNFSRNYNTEDSFTLTDISTSNCVEGSFLQSASQLSSSNHRCMSSSISSCSLHSI